MESAAETVDVLILGAGLSGIGAAHHLAERLPHKRFAILEARGAIGGTWDLFRYPGVRSDSDMYTLGYHFRPWREAKAIADGPSILNYVREAAADPRIAPHIRFRSRAVAAAWSSADSLWRVEVEHDDGRRSTVACRFLMGCTGYYDYSAGYTPDLPGLSEFAGAVIHPQHWPEGFDYAGKRVVVIGSGATAVTLAPALTDRAAHVTMLQRSPTYVVSRPAVDAMADALRRRLPAKLAYGLVRWRNVLLQLFFYTQMRKQPEKAKEQLIGMVRQEMGPDYDVAAHFTPRYNPWDQRLCLVPDSDLFNALKSGRAAVVTGEIARVEPGGVRLTSGERVAADVLVTATGLQLQPVGGMALSVDGARVNLHERLNYRGAMVSDVPNFVSIFGYTNASWTLKADLVSAWVCRLLAHMDRRGFASATPHNNDPTLEAEDMLSFTSGYVRRAMHLFPRQGSKPPWRLHQNYLLDLLTLRHSRLEDGVLRFARAGERVAPPAAAPPLKEAA